MIDISEVFLKNSTLQYISDKLKVYFTLNIIDIYFEGEVSKFKEHDILENLQMLFQTQKQKII